MTSRISLICILLFFISTAGFSQSKYDKVLTKADAYYEQGDYLKAQKTLTKLRKKAKKKLGVNNKYEAIAKMELVKYNIDMGKLTGFESQLEDAISTSVSANGEGTLEHGLSLLDASKLYMGYGNPLKAKEYLDQAEEIFSKSENLNDIVKARLTLVEIEVLIERGFYKDALKLVKKNEDYFRGRAVTRVSEVDASGKLKSRTLDPVERNVRYSEYANLMILKGQALGRMGNIVETFNVLFTAKEWIKKNLGKGHLLYAKAQYVDAKLLEEHAGTLGAKNAGQNLEDALKSIEKDHKDNHAYKLTIENAILKNFLVQGENKKFRRDQSYYEKDIKSYYGKDNLHYLVNITLELDAKLNKDRVTDLENKAVAIVASDNVLPEYHPIKADVLEFLYTVALVDEKFQNGENYLNDILKIKKEIYGEDSPLYHLTNIQLATHKLKYKDDIQGAGEVYKSSFDGVIKKELEPTHVEYIEILYQLAEYYEITDDYEMADETLKLVRETIDLKYRDESDPDLGVALSRIASLQLKIGSYDEVRSNINKSINVLKEYRKQGYRVDYSEAIETQAKLLAIQGEFDEAENALNKSQKEAGKASLTMQIDSEGSIDELANLFINLGKYSDTEKLLIYSIDQKQKSLGPNTRKLVTPLVDLASLQLIYGEYTQAEETARRAYNIANEFYGGNSTKVAPALIMLTDIYLTIGDYDNAETNIRRAIEIQENQFGRNHIDVAKSIDKLALIKFYKGDDLKEVEELLVEAKFIISGKLGSSNPQYALVLKDLATIYIADHKFDEAFRLLEEADKIWQQRLGSRNNVNAANIYLLEGDIHYIKRDYVDAEASYMKAKRLYQKIFNKNHPEYVKVLSKLSKVYYMSKDYKKSKNNLDEALENYQNYIKNFFPALTEAQKTKYWNKIKLDFEFYNSFAVEHKDMFPDAVQTIFNNALLTKAILLSSSIKMRERILNSDDEQLKAKYSEWVAKKEVLTNVLSMSKEQLLENQIVPEQLQLEIESLEKELSNGSELFAQGFENKEVTWDLVQNVLMPNEVAIEMVRFRHFDQVFSDSVIYAGLVTRKGLDKPELIVMPNGHDLENKFMKGYRNSMKFKIPDRYSYANYWKPIKDKVGNFSTIYLSADGVFNQINLETIPTGDGMYVLDNSNIVLVSNTKDIYFHRIKSEAAGKENKATMFGDPIFYASAGGSNKWSQLPGTKAEITALNEILVQNGWISDYYLEEYATEDNMKKIDNPKILHVATHGFFTADDAFEANEEVGMEDAKAAQNPLLRTGLLLYGAGDLLDKTSYNYNMEGGILTAYEAMNMNLDYTELVVLSACETGLGDVISGEGVYGLQRAFLVAGADALVMSLFKVSDDATQKLMVKFYEKWTQTGQMRNSFIEAKKELRNEYKDPIFWGAFVMIGME